MASCAVCATSLREGATHCTTCGTPTGLTPPPTPAFSGPSPFESETSWIDPPSPFEPGTSWETADAPPPAARPAAVAPRRSRVVTVIVAAALVAVVAALVAVVALPRLLPVDPQKFVGDWAYTGNAADRVVITRVDNSFTIVFVGQDGRRESLPGMISDKKLVIDYDALGPQGKVVEKLAESIGAKLSISYRKSDDRLLLSGSNASQGSFTIVMARTSAV